MSNAEKNMKQMNNSSSSTMTANNNNNHIDNCMVRLVNRERHRARETTNETKRCIFDITVCCCK